MTYCLEVSQALSKENTVFIFSYGIQGDIEFKVTYPGGKKCYFDSMISFDELYNLRNMCDAAINHQTYVAKEVKK